MHQHLTKWQRRRRRLRLSIQGAIAFVVIGGAVVLACVAVAMPWLVSHPEKVRAFLSEKLKRPVTFRALQGRWSPRGPIFTLDGVSLVDPTGGGSFDIDRAELVIDFYSWMRKDASFSEFRVVGVQADVVRDAAGKITIARLAGGAKSANANNTLFDLGGVSLGSAQVELRDEERGTSLSLSRVDLRMVNDGASRRFGGVAWIDAQSPPLRFACVADPRVAHCHVLARELEPALWLAQMPLAGIQPMSGKASAEIWFDYVDGRLESLRVETEAEQLVLRGTEPVPLGDGLAIEPRTQLTDWRAAARWRRDAQGWRLDVLEWRGDDDVPDTQLKLVARDTPNGRGYGVEASRLELSRLAPLAALSSAVPPKLRAVLFEGAPRGRLSNLRASFGHGRLASLSADVEKLSLRPGERTPGFGTISGRLLGDGDAIVFMPRARERFDLDFPHVFSDPLPVELRSGTFGAWRGADGWRIEGVDLDFTVAGASARARASVWFDPEGTKPSLDTTVAVVSGEVPKARMFWPINVMPEKTREWLDRALVAGRVDGGLAIVRGDLDDWPFKQDTGRFEAHANIAALTLDYHPRWPAARCAHRAHRRCRGGRGDGHPSAHRHDHCHRVERHGPADHVARLVASGARASRARRQGARAGVRRRRHRGRRPCGGARRHVQLGPGLHRGHTGVRGAIGARPAGRCAGRHDGPHLARRPVRGGRHRPADHGHPSRPRRRVRAARPCHRRTCGAWRRCARS